MEPTDYRTAITNRQWTVKDAQRVKAAGPSDTNVLLCAQGQHMVRGGEIRLRNLGSHRRGGSGGTVSTFADGHVEWVKGSQIGWP
jgi:prepilin-type processing-associated H-X9-DG protein